MECQIVVHSSTQGGYTLDMTELRFDRLDWDAGNDTKYLLKHGVDQKTIHHSGQGGAKVAASHQRQVYARKGGKPL
jgi:hypothetical protein